MSSSVRSRKRRGADQTPAPTRPAPPRSRRRLTPARRSLNSRPPPSPRRSRQRLLHCLHGRRHLPPVGRRDLAVRHEPAERVRVAVVVEQVVDRPEALGDRPRASSDRSCRGPASRSRKPARPLDVGLEVEQIDVGVTLLLAGDLRLRDLVQQAAGAVEKFGRLVGQAWTSFWSLSTSICRPCRRGEALRLVFRTGPSRSRGTPSTGRRVRRPRVHRSAHRD